MIETVGRARINDKSKFTTININIPTTQNDQSIKKNLIAS